MTQSRDNVWPETVAKKCPSWICKGKERVFVRVVHVVVKHPVFEGEFRTGPRPAYPSYAEKQPCSWGRCPECDILLFIGPIPEEVEAYVKQKEDEAAHGRRPANQPRC